MKKIGLIIFVLLFCISCNKSAKNLPAPSIQNSIVSKKSAITRWALVNQENLNQSLVNYDLVVFDLQKNANIRPLTDRGKLVFNTINFASIAKSDKYFSALQNAPVPLIKIAGKEEHFVVDLRSKEWTELLLQQLIPVILRQGFDGIYIDDIDQLLELEKSNPQSYGGLAEAALKNIKTVRRHYPEMKIMMQNATNMSAKFAPYIDLLMVKALLSRYQESTPHYQPRNENEIKNIVLELEQAKKANSKLEILTLDFSDPQDKKGIKQIYEQQRKFGFIPSVSSAPNDGLLMEPS